MPSKLGDGGWGKAPKPAKKGFARGTQAADMPDTGKPAGSAVAWQPGMTMDSVVADRRKNAEDRRQNGDRRTPLIRKAPAKVGEMPQIPYSGRSDTHEHTWQFDKGGNSAHDLCVGCDTERKFTK